MDSFAYAVTLSLWTLLYFAPGVLLAEVFLSSTFSFPKRLATGAAFSISLYILLGFVFSRFSVLSHNSAMAAILALDILTMAFYLIWRHRSGSDPVEALRGLTRKDLFIAAVLVLIFALSILVFFTWENQGPGIGAWDRSDHLPRMLYLDHHQHLPEHELGTEVSPYYPRGLHTAALFYSAPFFSTRSPIELSSPLLAFIAVCIGLLPLALFALSLACFDDWQTALFSSLCFLVLSFTFIFTSFPCTLGILLSTAAVMLELEFVRGRCGAKVFLLFTLLSSAVFLVHLVTFGALMVLSLAVLAGALISGEKIGFKRRNAWVLAGLIAASLVLPLLFLAATSPALLKGTRTYLGVRETGEAKVSNQSPGKILRNLFSFRISELQGVLYYCLAVVPFLILGSLHLLRRRQWVPIALLLGGIFISVSKLLWFTNRVSFYILIPLTLIGGYGLRLFLARGRGGQRALISWALIPALFVTAALGTACVSAKRGYSLTGQGFFAPEGRVRTYVTQESLDLARWVADNDLEGIRFATDDQGAHYLMVEALTDARLIMASKFSGVESFSDISELFDPETTRERRLEIMEEYGVSGLITTRGWLSNRLLRDGMGLEAVMPVTGFYVLFPAGTLGQE